MRFSMTIALAFFCLLGGRAGADDNVKAVIEKAIKAHGGEEKLTKFKAIDTKASGTISQGGMEIEFTAHIIGQLPDKIREEINLEIMGRKVSVIRAYDGKKGWKSANGQIDDLSDAEVKEIKDELFGNYIESLMPLLKDKDLKVTLIGDDKIDDKPVVGIKVTKEGQRDAKLYFDKDSGLLVKSEHKTDHDGQEVNSETISSDFKSVDGLMEAMKVVTNLDGKKFLELKVTDCKVLEKVDDSNFAKP